MAKWKPRKCPYCHGEGYWFMPVIKGSHDEKRKCAVCHGTGKVASKKRFYQTLGYMAAEARERYIREHPLEKGR